MAPIRETRERDKSRREKEAEYWFGLSKIVFTAMVVGSVMSYFGNTLDGLTCTLIAIVGILATYALYYIGHLLLTTDRK